jgi:Zn finger protein HypA/HybF involved in hydrogenase expression
VKPPVERGSATEEWSSPALESSSPGAGTMPTYDPERVMRTCPNCSATLEESRCKLLCPRCHYYMSCSDYV